MRMNSEIFEKELIKKHSHEGERAHLIVPVKLFGLENRKILGFVFNHVNAASIFTVVLFLLDIFHTQLANHFFMMSVLKAAVFKRIKERQLVRMDKIYVIFIMVSVY